MADKPDGKAAGASQRVTFTRPAAERIASVVRKVEAGSRDSAPLNFRGAPIDAMDKVFRIGTYSGAWSIETDKTVTFYNQTTTPNTVTVRNHFVDLQHGPSTDANWKCGIAKDGTAWKLVSWQQNTATAIFIVTVTETVVLNDVLLSFNTANCSIAKTNVTTSIVVIGTTATASYLFIPFVPSSSSAWTPANIATSLWLDMSDTANVTLSGTEITDVLDKSGNARNFSQSTASLRPTRAISAAFNGLHVAVFDGADDVLNGVAVSNFFSNSSYSAFVVGRATVLGTDSGNGYENEAFYGDTGGFVALFVRSSGLIGAYNWDGNNDVATKAYTANTVVMGYAELSSGQIRTRTNGGTETASNSGNLSNLSNNMQIGRQYNSNNYALQGEIGEIIFIDSALSTTNRQLIEGYLAWKWGLEGSLPVGHPHKNAAP